MIPQHFELLSPAGDMERLNAALRFGADAVYVGGPKLQLRAGSVGFTPEALGEAVRKLYETQIIPARKAGLAADVYTQLSDVEDEVNGFVTYDRRVEKLPEALMQAIARELKGE